MKKLVLISLLSCLCITLFGQSQTIGYHQTSMQQLKYPTSYFDDQSGDNLRITFFGDKIELCRGGSGRYDGINWLCENTVIYTYNGKQEGWSIYVFTDYFSDGSVFKELTVYVNQNKSKLKIIQKSDIIGNCVEEYKMVENK